MSGRPGWSLLAETGVDLLWASAQLRTREFAAIVADRASRPSDRNAFAEDARLLARALSAWERRLPWRVHCFEKALAADRWLRRRGLRSTLHYGARGSDSSLEAHVWVTSGGTPVVGCENASDFRELARYPAD